MGPVRGPTWTGLPSCSWGLSPMEPRAEGAGELWESLYAASLAPSYLNRQAYGFLLNQGNVWLVRRPDQYTTKDDGELSLGIVLHHFSSVAENWMGKLNWRFYPEASALELPEGHEAVAVCSL